MIIGNMIKKTGDNLCLISYFTVMLCKFCIAAGASEIWKY